MAKTTKKHGCLWWALIGWWYVPLDRLTDAKPKQPAAPARPVQCATPKPAGQKQAKPWETVYVTAQGKVYHYDEDCPTLRGGKAYKMDRSKARASGRSLCKKCEHYWDDVWY